MTVPTFVDLQGFIVGSNFVVKEFAALRGGVELSHYIFGSQVPWSWLTKAEKRQAIWLIANRHGIRWEDGAVPYCYARDLITKAVVGIEDDGDGTSPIVYVKGPEKREWLKDMLLDKERQYVYIEDIGAHYEDIQSLNKLDVMHTLRCQKHHENCALQNVFKVYNWWCHSHHK